MSKLVPTDSQVIIRSYGVGVGDCFLLAFPDGKSTFYMLIDCGIAKNTPNGEDIMKAVVRDIGAATGGTIDVMVVTHEHYDHTSGFSLAEEAWQELRVKEVWLSWIENEAGGEEAESIREKKKKLVEGVQKSLEKTRSLDLKDSPEIHAELDFLGFAAAQKKTLQQQVAVFSNTEYKKVFCEPGQVRSIPGGVADVFVLGPPRYYQSDKTPIWNGKTFYLRLLEDKKAMYGFEDVGLKADAVGGSHALSVDDALLAFADDLDQSEETQPFDQSYRMPWDSVKEDSFFAQTYFKKKSKWRNIDEEWLEQTSELAIKAGNFINNTCLALAIRLRGSGRVLLFPGDAQVGNWLSWHTIPKWTAVETQIEEETLNQTATTLLNNVVFYKVGHHGSHNATVKDKGLELMGKKPFVAYVPVSVPVAHDVTGYCPIPYYPVLKRLQEKTQGHVYFANGKKLEPDANPTDLPNGVAIQRSETMHDLGEIETDLPLYTDFTISQ